MTRKTFNRFAMALALTPLALAVAAAPSFAQATYNLAAVQTSTTIGSQVITMWGYVLDTGSCPGVPAPWGVGPTLSANPGETLTINLRNCLSEDVSIFIPGQYKPLSPVMENTDGTGRLRATSFDTPTTPGMVGTYQWFGLEAGSYLYHSGTHPQVQVQMGLYGALTVGAYAGVATDVALVYSEIDPALHAAVAGGTYGTPAYPSTFDYQPKYFLINGKSHPDTSPIALATGQDALLRFVNAGLKTHVPTLEGGLYMDLVAEDGSLYPYPRVQYGFELGAGKTIDALLSVGEAGTYPLYDRDLHLTNAAATGGGMLIYLNVGAATGAPVATDDNYTTSEDTPLSVVLPGVLGNDTAGSGPGPLTATLVSSTSAGLLTLNDDGSFTYTPDADFNGTDFFTYLANDGGPDSNVATVSISVTPVNDAPVANPDTYDAPQGQTISVPAPGVLGNDSDVDGDTLTAVLAAPPLGTLALNANGSFTYTPAGLAGAVETFTYVANDGTLSSAAVTVTINVITATNDPPVAVDDTATTTRNTSVNIYVIGNDTDPQGNSTIVPTSIVIVDPPSRGGTAVVSGIPGFVTYTPRRNFRGTDTFTYTITDDQGAVSNIATVRVNVVR